MFCPAAGRYVCHLLLRLESGEGIDAHEIVLYERDYAVTALLLKLKIETQSAGTLSPVLHWQPTTERRSVYQ